MFEYLGGQLALYCGKDLGDLVLITLNKCVVVPSWVEIEKIIIVALWKRPWRSFCSLNASTFHIIHISLSQIHCCHDVELVSFSIVLHFEK